eukprot:jgi/Mesen1/6963/ME000360S06227
MSGASLTPVQKIQYLQDCTGISDAQQSSQILEAHGWDLDAAVATVLAVSDRDGSGLGAGPSAVRDVSGAGAGPSSAVPSLRARNATPSSGPNPAAQEDVQDLHDNPGRLAGRRQTSIIGRLLSIPLYMFRASFSLLLKTVTTGVWAAGGLLSYPLAGLSTLATWAAGGSQPYSRLASLPAVSESSIFRQRFEAEYGPVHPRFEDLTFMQAVRRAQEQFKFLFVYLHSSGHANTPRFCDGTLCSPTVAAFIDAHFVSWGADVRSSEGFQMSNSLKASTYPFCAVVAGSANQRVALLQQERERKRQEEEEQRRLAEEEEARRQQQEELAKLAAEREAAELEAALQRRREEKAAVLGAEPEKAPDVTQVRFSLPTGDRKERRFHSTALVQSLYNYVDSLGALKSLNYRLVTNFPRMVYGPGMLDKTLKEVGLHPAATLFIQEEDN